MMQASWTMSRKLDREYMRGAWRLKFIVSLMICCIVVSGCKAHETSTPNRAVSSPAPEPAHSEDVADADRRDLQLIGKKIATAILEKDSATLLSYDRDDLRVEDEASLKDKTGPLYCYLFDPSCYKDAKIASVHEILSTAQQLEVSASVAKSPDGHEYGLLLFYDKSQISEKQLHSDFLCTDEAFKRVASWHFIRIGKKWSAASPLFDLETEGACPDSD